MEGVNPPIFSKRSPSLRVALPPVSHQRDRLRDKFRADGAPHSQQEFIIERDRIALVKIPVPLEKIVAMNRAGVCDVLIALHALPIPSCPDDPASSSVFTDKRSLSRNVVNVRIAELVANRSSAPRKHIHSPVARSRAMFHACGMPRSGPDCQCVIFAVLASRISRDPSFDPPSKRINSSA